MTAIEKIPPAAVARLQLNGSAVFEALAQSGAAVVVTDPSLADNPIVFVNEGFTRQTGYTAEDALGRNCRFLQTPNTDPAAIGKLRDAVLRGEDISIDVLNARKDGRPFWNRIHVAPIRDDQGRPILFLSTQTDVTSELARDEIELRQSAVQAEMSALHARLRRLHISAGASGAWEWDARTKILTGDARFADLCGLDPIAAADGLPTEAFFANIDPQDVMRVRLGFAGALHGVEVFARDYRVNRGDGTQSWVAARGRAFAAADGSAIRIAGILSDVTDQKRVQEQLRVAQTAGGVGTFEYLSGFGTADVSEQFCRLLGLQPAETLPVRTINSVIHPDDPPLLGRSDDQILGPTFREFRIRRADTGEERWLARRGENRREGFSAGTRFIGVIYDVTQSKITEQRLVEATEALAQRVEFKTRERDQVWNLTHDLLAVFGPDGYHQAVNPAWEAVLGYAQEEVIGARFDAFVLREDLAGLSDRFRTLVAGEPMPDFDCRMKAKDGGLKWINWTIILNDGSYYATGRDITVRLQLEEQLRQSQKMEAIGQLTGGLAHDFNNMLTGVIGGLDIVKRRIAQGRVDNLDRFLDSAMSAAQRAAALTRRLLAFARRQSLDSHAVIVNALIASIEEFLRRTLGEQVTLKTELSPDAWPVLADANQLESAILNLAINARDAMEKGGILTIATRNVNVAAPTTETVGNVLPGDYVEISIEDTGSGMPPDVLAKAFDPFYTIKPIGQGTGLGLSMVYGFVQQSKGHISVDSRVGIGTKICIYLPRTTDQAKADLAPSQQARGAGERVLVVEDDESVRMLVLEVLNELGYSAVEAQNAETAIDLLQSGGPLDLMVTDVGLPGMNGRQLAEIVREYYPDLPVLFMTGYAPGAKVRAEFLAPGMEMIEKPFLVDALATRIRDMLVAKER
jgi:PAS domain S-box-containing protein